MKNLGKTIDQLIRVDPHLEKKLVRIKDKWQRRPSKIHDYWEELLKYLNSETLISHPKRAEMKDILNPKKKIVQELYSFEPIHPSDIMIGVIPENIADIIRKHDRWSIQVAKIRVEANLTRNENLIIQVYRKEMLLEISTKKLWLRIKDHFNLWNKSASYSIKFKDSLLYLVEQGPPPPQILGNGVVKMDSDTFKNFLRFLGIGNIPPQLSEED